MIRLVCIHNVSVCWSQRLSILSLLASSSRRDSCRETGARPVLCSAILPHLTAVNIMQSWLFTGSCESSAQHPFGSCDLLKYIQYLLKSCSSLALLIFLIVQQEAREEGDLLDSPVSNTAEGCEKISMTLHYMTSQEWIKTLPLGLAQWCDG